MRDIYLDNSATTPVLPEVVEAMGQVMLSAYGNPSSLHGKGLQAENLIRESRRRVAEVLGAEPQEIFFTSGGTEANNWAVLGAARRRRGRGRHLVTSSIEHASVLHAFQLLEDEGFQVTYLPVNEKGLLELEDLDRALQRETVLVSVMHVNNEVGSVQNLAEIGFLIREKAPDAVFHVDAVQGFGKLPLNPAVSSIDLMSLSAHKIHGPKGTGALYIRKGVFLDALLVGGEQEGGLRAGTENVPGIVGMGLAAEKAGKNLAVNSGILWHLKKELVRGILAIPGARINGPDWEEGAPHILNVYFEGVDRGEVLVHMLEEKGIYVSTGSACHSRRAEPSHVLKAMGLKKEGLFGAIRISLSPFNTLEQIQEALELLAEVVGEFRELKGGR
ncbi:MAG: cysteine desulfurase [Clostridia bacterium]|jgi:cysteine desulfurase|nr:cysteine desulfurase [Clostridia bacterium]